VPRPLVRAGRARRGRRQWGTEVRDPPPILSIVIPRPQSRCAEACSIAGVRALGNLPLWDEIYRQSAFGYMETLLRRKLPCNGEVRHSAKRNSQRQRRCAILLRRAEGGEVASGGHAPCLKGSGASTSAIPGPCVPQPAPNAAFAACDGVAILITARGAHRVHPSCRHNAQMAQSCT
jgi:hypothetical protein